MGVRTDMTGQQLHFSKTGMDADFGSNPFNGITKASYSAEQIDEAYRLVIKCYHVR